MRPPDRSPRHRPSVAGPAVLVLLLLVGGCLDSGGGVGPGADGEIVVLHARLESPNGPEGAVLLDVATDEVRGIRAVDDQTEVLGRSAGERSHIAVVRDFPGTIEFEVLAPESPELPEIRVLQVADWENRLRDDPESYRLVVRR